jgi:putative copper export protein/mono/diheme cytochrome c family protein
MSVQDFLLFALRAAVLLVEAGLFGTLAVRAFAVRQVGERLLDGLFVALPILLPCWLVVQATSMADAHGPVAIADATLLVLQASWVGHLTLLRAGAWGLTWLVLYWRAHWSPHWALLPAGLALALHAGAGHAAAIGDDWLFVSVLAHVLAAASWVGGLPALYLALEGPDPARLVRRYTWFGLACVAVVAVTAAAQAWVLAGGVVGLIGTDYGHAILVKIALLIVLLLLACRHRFVLAPRLPASLSSLRRSVLLETAIGVAVLCVASLLSSLPPGAHAQATWPFPWRISFALMDDEELRREVIDAARALVGAGLLLLLAVLSRRIRWLAVTAAAVIVWFAVPHLDLLLLPTEPTYYWQSTTGFSADSIETGRQAYARNCVSCHGAGGAGDGPQAKTLPIPPADLTAPHLWEHSDGELFWWIGHGMNGPDGHRVMPGFADTLDEDTRWALIDFLHANNHNVPDGASVGGMHHHF